MSFPADRSRARRGDDASTRTGRRALPALALGRLYVDLVDASRLDAHQLAALDQVKAGIVDAERGMQLATNTPNDFEYVAALENIAQILRDAIDGIGRVQGPPA